MHLGDSREKYFEIDVHFKVSHNKPQQPTRKYRYPAAIVVDISENKLELPAHGMTQIFKVR